MFISPLTEIKAKEAYRRKNVVSKSLFPDLEERDSKSIVIEVSNGELPHLSPSRTLKFCDFHKFEN